MREVKTLGLLGTGVIGGGWAARAMHFGIDVVAADTNPAMEKWIRDSVANADVALSRLTLAPLPPKGRLSFTTDMHAMARQADFIQENIPEQLPLKQRVLAEISRSAGPGVIIASSTSGLMPTDLQRDMVAPERLLVGHPFNPVYLLPLCELVGGEKTSAATIEAARRFYQRIGMHTLHVRKEVPGHLTDRLQEAMWREILHMVNEGVATTGELDESIIYGPGLRWAAMGMNLIYTIAGGEAGMHHFMKQFGPALKWPWTKLEAPELTDALIDQMVKGTDEQAAGRSIRELERTRDDYLVAIQQVLRRFNIGAGATLRSLEERLYREHANGVKKPGTGGATGRMHGTVRPEWVDYNGHMTDSRYLQVFGDAMDVLYRSIGVDEAYRAAGHMFYTVETHGCYRAELKVEEPYSVDTRVLEVTERSLRVIHSLYRDRDGALAATGEEMHVHVDTRAGKAAVMPAPVRTALQKLKDARRGEPVPAEAGRAIGVRHGKAVSRPKANVKPRPKAKAKSKAKPKLKPKVKVKVKAKAKAKRKPKRRR
jgi:carnitine 3-dehydrogenase